jgi:hypothetical protein
VAPSPVRIAGLAEARRALKKLGDPREIDNAFKQAGREVSAKVVTRAQTFAAATGRKEVVRAARTIVPVTRVGGAAISLGKKTGPDRWAAAALFGTHPDRLRNSARGDYLGWKQFTAPTKDGGPLYRAFRAEKQTIEDAWLDAIERVFNS